MLALALVLGLAAEGSEASEAASSEASLWEAWESAESECAGGISGMEVGVLRAPGGGGGRGLLRSEGERRVVGRGIEGVGGAVGSRGDDVDADVGGAGTGEAVGRVSKSEKETTCGVRGKPPGAWGAGGGIAGAAVVDGARTDADAGAGAKTAGRGGGVDALRGLGGGGLAARGLPLLPGLVETRPALSSVSEGI